MEICIRGKSFLSLDWHRSSGLQARFRRRRKHLGKLDHGGAGSSCYGATCLTWNRSVTLDSNRWRRRSVRQVFGRNRSRYDAYERTLFPWQLGVSTALPEPPTNANEQAHRRHRRSIEAPQRLPYIEYNAGRRHGPPRFDLSEETVNATCKSP